MEALKNRIETQETPTYEKNAYVVGDSLSVGMTTGINISKSVEGGKQTKWMLESLQNNTSAWKDKKVMFLLGGTNDIFSNHSSEDIIKRIDAIAQLAKNNNVKIVVGTIPPFSSDAKTVQNSLKKLNTSAEVLQKRIDEVNTHIKNTYWSNVIDYNAFLRDPNKNAINPIYEGKQGDGIHPYNAYAKMRELQKLKFQEIMNTNNHGEVEKWNQSPEKTVSQNIKVELDNLKKEIDAEQNETRKRELFRKLVRLERFSNLQDGKDISDAELQKQIQKILKNKNSDTYSNSDLLTLRKKGIDIASLTLTYKNNPKTEVSSKNINAGDSFTVNFGANDSLRRRTGAGDILPPEIRTVKINGVEAERRNTPRPGYYDNKGKYQPIYDGYSIEIVKKWNALPEDATANEARWKQQRAIETYENNNKPLTDLPEDLEIQKTAKAEYEALQRMPAEESFGAYATNKPLSETVKRMNDLTPEESAGLAKKVFGNGGATDLLITLDGRRGSMIQRMIALGWHEGGLKFGRRNPDPASGFNIGTFQIGGSGTNESASLQKYNKNTQEGIKLASEYGIRISENDLNSPAQRDLITHLGYINSERGGRNTLNQLANPNLSESAVITLMHNKIQGGIREIGQSVVSQIANNKIDTSRLA